MFTQKKRQLHFSKYVYMLHLSIAAEYYEVFRLVTLKKLCKMRHMIDFSFYQVKSYILLWFSSHNLQLF